jgi:hypothetical protein
MDALRKDILAFKDNVKEKEYRARVFPQLKQYADEQLSKRATPKKDEPLSPEIDAAYVRERGVINALYEFRTMTAGIEDD